jgi:hypothetical protein
MTRAQHALQVALGEYVVVWLFLQFAHDRARYGALDEMPLHPREMRKAIQWLCDLNEESYMRCVCPQTMAPARAPSVQPAAPAAPAERAAPKQRALPPPSMQASLFGDGWQK